MDPLRRVTRAQKVALAAKLRRTATPFERHAWSSLRERGMLGLKFRRQHVLRGFIVDFYCPAARLVLTLEGDAHDGPDQRAYDAARAEVLRAAGFRVVRMRNRYLTRAELEAVLRAALTRPRVTPWGRS
jgi:very-short-patch-repair endonuclease